MSDTTTQNTQYMLLFTIGPVQSFIAQARKTRDLWLGSYLLSLLMEAGMRGMDNVLVFPTRPYVEGRIPDLPNRYIAIYKDKDEAIQAAKDSETRIKEDWKKICKDVWNRVVRGEPSNTETEKIWDRQVDPDRFFEVFWVIVAQNNEQEKYGSWLDKTQLALAARKHLRHVKRENPTGKDDEEAPESGEKSTISGDREALRNSNTTTDRYRPAVRAFWQQLIKANELSALDINPSGEERLDAIDTVKRFAYRSSIVKKKLKTEDNEKKGAGFPSTSSIATASFVEQILRRGDADTKRAFQEWFDVTSKDNLGITPANTIPYFSDIVPAEKKLLEVLVRDGDCYFRETFVSTRLEKDYDVPRDKPGEKNYSNNVAARGRDGLRDLFKATDALNITRPTPYYAMVQMDGDKMGVLLGKVSGEREHKKISEKLSEFSQAAETLVEKQYPGRLIYAGGDDVFALAPLARDIIDDIAKNDEPLIVLQLADKLQQKYHDIVEKAVVGDDRKQSVTASTGIAIAHHFTSLSYVRRASKEAESQAKKTYGRNSLVITLLRRSGEQTRVGCRWRYKVTSKDGQETILDPIDTFSEFYKLFKEDKLSPKLVYLLLEEAPALVHPSLFLPQDPDGKITEADWQGMANNVRAMQRSEIKRVLRRQRSSQEKGSGTTDDDTIRLADNLVALATAMDADTRKSNQNAQEEEKTQLVSKEKTRAVELHSEDRRYGLVEVLGWLQVMVFLTRKEQE